MKEPIEGIVVDTLNYLMTIVNDETRPAEAKSGFRPLQQRHPDVGMQLIWEEEAYDHSVHYDALLNLPEHGTISVSYCNDRARPWPLRGVHRWSDSEFVRVNGEALYVDQVIACLDFIWDESRITERLVNGCLVREELERSPIDLSDEELQRAMDAFRRARKLYKAEDAHCWMERRGITHRELTQLVSTQATVLKLREKIAGPRVEDYFNAHSTDFDSVYLARLPLADEAEASALAERIRNGEVDFVAEAQRRFVSAKRAGRPTMDLFTAVQRRDAPEEIRNALFEAGPGSVLGPARDGDNDVMVRVVEIARAHLDEGTRESIKNILFEEWLEQRRQAASIEWLWGNARTTGMAFARP